MKLRLGELFAGYGGLGMAVEEVFGATTAWFSEFEEGPSKILAHRWPGVPNHGDITKIDWAEVEPVDIISGGSPCQDLSLAGKRRGMTNGTRSNLFESMLDGIEIIRPKFVVWENVRGALSAGAISDLEQSEGRLGADGDPNLRALGRVLGGLADLGYDAEWRGLTAANVGATHGRFRVFLLAALPDAHFQGLPLAGNAGVIRPTQPGPRPAALGNTALTEDSDVAARGERRLAAPGQAQSGRARPDARGRSGAPTADTNGGDDAWGLGDTERGQEWREATTGSGEGRGATQDTLRVRSPGGTAQPEQAGGNDAALGSNQRGTNWGEYEPAPRRSTATRS